MARRLNSSAFMGRKSFRGAYAGGSQQALNAQFQASLNDVMSNLNAFIDEVDGIVPDVLIESLEPTFGKALEYCPEKSGRLRNSGYLEARKYYKGAEVEIGFGRGGNPDYAIFVHEMPFYHEPPTRGKFLQAALEEDYFSILTSIPRLLREATGA
jgi:hypothetical protein